MRLSSCSSSLLEILRMSVDMRDPFKERLSQLRSSHPNGGKNSAGAPHGHIAIDSVRVHGRDDLAVDNAFSSGCTVRGTASQGVAFDSQWTPRPWGNNQVDYRLATGSGADVLAMVVKDEGMVGGHSSVDTGAGDDVLHVLSEQFTLDVALGAGNDRAEIEGWADTTVDAGAGNDTVNVDGASQLSVFAGTGDDAITIAGSCCPFVEGGEGDDRIIANRVGAATIRAGDGRDLIALDGGGTVSAGAGSDLITVAGDGGTATVLGDEGDDVIVFQEAWSVATVDGGSGNDTIVINSIRSKTRWSIGGGNDVVEYCSADERAVHAIDFGRLTRADVTVDTVEGEVRVRIKATGEMLTVRGLDREAVEQMIPRQPADEVRQAVMARRSVDVMV